MNRSRRRLRERLVQEMNRGVEELSFIHEKGSPVANRNATQSGYNQKVQPSGTFLKDMNN